MNYDQAIEKLKSAHLYPDINIEISKDHKEKVTGLQVYANSLLWERRKEMIIEAIGDKFKVEWMGGNLNYILITKK